MFELNTKELVLSNGNDSTQLRKIGQGGCGVVYKGVLGNRQLAVKILDIDIKGHSSKIVQNLASNRDLFSHNAFVSLVHIPQAEEWYIMEYFQSSDMAKQRHQSSDEKKQQAITAYAGMLKYLHDNGVLFVDNKWSSLLIGDNDRMMVCDYDCACPLDRIAGSIFNSITTPAYNSREALLIEQFHGELSLTKSSDLESFAHMIDDLYNRQGYLRTLIGHDEDLMVSQAIANKRAISSDRIKSIPSPLSKIVNALLTYPRDDSITIDDIISAVKQSAF